MAADAILSAAAERWLKSSELYELLTHPDTRGLQLSQHPPVARPSALSSLHFLDRYQCKRWRFDHHVWQTPERHVKLKIDGAPTINALYVRSAECQGFTRRSYWLLQAPQFILIHYRREKRTEKRGGGVKVVKEEQKEADDNDDGNDVNDNDDDDTQNPFLLPPSLSPPSLSLSLPPPLAASASSCMIVECCPAWDWYEGGSKALIVVSNSHYFDTAHTHCLFDNRPIPVESLSSGVYRIIVPSYRHQSHSLNVEQQRSMPAFMHVSLAVTDGKFRSSPIHFQYRAQQLQQRPSLLSAVEGQLSISPPRPSSLTPLIIPSSNIQSPVHSHRHHQPSANTTSVSASMSGVNSLTASVVNTPTSSVRHPGREHLSSLLRSVMSIERSMLLSPSSSPNFQSTFTLEDIQSIVLKYHGNDLLEGMLLSMFQSIDDKQTQRLFQTQSNHGKFIIHCCAGLGYKNIVRFLVQSTGVDVNQRDRDDHTPLHYAAINGDDSMVQTLVALGARNISKDTLGLSPLTGDAVDPVLPSSLSLSLTDWMNDNSTASSTPAEPSVMPTLSFSPISTSHSHSHGEYHSELIDDMIHAPIVQLLSPSSHSLSQASTPPATDLTADSSLSLDKAFAGLTLADMGVNTVELDRAFASSDVEFTDVVKKVQRRIRWWLYRRHYAAMKLQAAARGMLVRRSVKRMRDSAVIIQHAWSERKQRREAQTAAISITDPSPGSSSPKHSNSHSQPLLFQLVEEIQQRRSQQPFALESSTILVDDASTDAPYANYESASAVMSPVHSHSPAGLMIDPIEGEGVGNVSATAELSHSLLL